MHKPVSSNILITFEHNSVASLRMEPRHEPKMKTPKSEAAELKVCMHGLSDAIHACAQLLV